MSIVIPLVFRTRWANFFNIILPRFLGYNSYSVATPIVQAIINFSRLAVAFGIVWVIGRLIVKFVKVVF